MKVCARGKRVSRSHPLPKDREFKILGFSSPMSELSPVTWRPLCLLLTQSREPPKEHWTRSPEIWDLPLGLSLLPYQVSVHGTVPGTDLLG